MLLRFSALLLSINLAILLHGCTTFNSIQLVQPDPYVDSAFRLYLSKFMAEAEYRAIPLNTRHLTIQFDLDKDAGNETVGTCDLYRSIPTIKIDRKAWFEMPEGNREELIFHELGHCILLREHCDVRMEGKRISIMSMRIEDANEYNQRRQEYVDELFEPNARCGGNGTLPDGEHPSL